METQQDILTDSFSKQPAANNLRLVNLIIDVIVYYVLSFIAGFFLATFIVGAGSFAAYLIALIIIVGYYTIIEGATNGESVGKMVTKTRAVRENGMPFTFKDAFLRSLCRLIPFEQLSIFFGTNRPWHDTWTKTIVIKE